MTNSRISRRIHPAGSKPRWALVASLLALAAPLGAALAQPITVNTIEDFTDFPAPQTVAQLPGPDGVVSFREACIAANNTPGPQTIAFAIPQNQWWLWMDRATLRQEQSSPFTLSDDGTTVDFTTQTAFTGNTNPAGNEVAIYGVQPNAMGIASIMITGNNCTIIGLDRVQQRGHGIEIRGNNNRVIGCTITAPLYAAVTISGGFGGPSPTGNIIGGTLPGEGNTLSAGNHGIRIDAPAHGNIIIGNTLSGTYAGIAVRGSTFTGRPIGNRIGGPTPKERNIIAGAGRYGEEGFPDGAQISLNMAQDTLIEGNYIGTTPDGAAPHPSQRGPAGVDVADSAGTIIRGNVISGIRVVGVNHYSGQVFGDGVRIRAINGPTADTTVTGNIIGADPSGQFPVPNLRGVNISPVIASQPITLSTINQNLIAFSERTGVIVSSLVSGARITRNSIRDNGDLGIDLLGGPGGGAGVTPNDPGDPDQGANGLQNFPVLASAAASSQSVEISGAFNSTPNQQFTLEFFASPACDPSGHGEGALFLGSAPASTDSAGNTAFNHSFPTAPGAVQPGHVITATATHAASGNTSEFSACITAAAGSACYANCDGSTAPPILNVDDFTCFINEFAVGQSLSHAQQVTHYANCDGSTTAPVLNVDDFTCFINQFALGCP